jgi:hypothetical protein
MTFPILGGNGAVAGGYAIDNSLRFNDDDSAHLSRTPSSSSNRKTWTWSGWVKRSTLGTQQKFFVAGTSDSNRTMLYFETDNTLRVYFRASGVDYGRGSGSAVGQVSTAIFRDVSAWYHILVSVDLTASDASSPLRADANRLKFYVNGIQQTNDTSHTFANFSLTQNTDTLVNHTNEHSIGLQGNDNTGDFDGYMAEVYLIDGTAKSPTDFGEFDSDSGIWKVKEYDGSYGTNGFKLNFSDSGSLGADSSPNSNSFTPSNLSATDQTTDTPTNNFCTLNPNDNYWANSTFSEGNCKMVTAGSGYGYPRSTMGISSGKWYFEAKASNLSGNLFVGIVSTTGTGTEQEVGNKSNDYGYKFTSGAIRENTVETSYGNSLGTSDILGVGIDLDNNKLYFSKNGTWQNSANPETNTGGFSITAPSSTLLGEYFASASDINSSNSSTVAFNFGNPAFSITSGNSDGNGYGNFEYAPPSGYLALCTQNLATELSPTIDDGSAYFHTQLYTGNRSSSQTITNDASAGDFQPDWVWIKQRNDTVAHSHVLFDSTRGVTKGLASNLSEAEYTSSSAVTSFNTDGFSIGNGASVNQPDRDVDYVAWQWKANGGTTSSNTDGSITSTVQANTTAGFSIVTYTSASGSQTVGHGLGKSLDMYIIKERTTSGDDWFVYHSSLGAGAKLRLSGTSASSSDTSIWNNTEPTTTVFSVGNDQGGVNQNTGGNQDYVAYCFAEIEGYSSINSYTGNGSTDGTFVYTGFRPAWVLRKCSTAAEQWHIQDTKRLDFNNDSNSAILIPSTSAAEATNTNLKMDILSNGFKCRASDGAGNGSGRTYIYMAFAENPFSNSNGIPVTAR